MDEQGDQITHYVTIVSIGATTTRLGFSLDLCRKLGIRHTHALRRALVGPRRITYLMG
jgi:hypothetical protein